jgi:predicted anti-sigma-YlaC factor YlaD
LIAALAFSVATAGVALGRAWWSSASSGAVIDVVILAGLFISATGGHHTRLQHSR